MYVYTIQYRYVIPVHAIPITRVLCDVFNHEQVGGGIPCQLHVRTCTCRCCENVFFFS